MSTLIKLIRIAREMTISQSFEACLSVCVREFRGELLLRQLTVTNGPSSFTIAFRDEWPRVLLPFELDNATLSAHPRGNNF